MQIDGVTDEAIDKVLDEALDEVLGPQNDSESSVAQPQDIRQLQRTIKEQDETIARLTIMLAGKDEVIAAHEMQSAKIAALKIMLARQDEIIAEQAAKITVLKSSTSSSFASKMGANSLSSSAFSMFGEDWKNETDTNFTEKKLSGMSKRRGSESE